MKMVSGNKKVLSALGLFAATVAWGTSFSLVKDLTSAIGVWSFLFWRFLMAMLLLLPFAIKSRHGFLTGIRGIQVGFLIFLILGFQTLGLQWTTATRSGFITSMYVVLMPFGLWIYFKRPVALRHLLVALVALVGLYLLTNGASPTGLSLSNWVQSINRGDVFTLLAATACVFQIVMTEKYVKKIPDLINFGFWQFVGCFIAVMICITFFDECRIGIWNPRYWMPVSLAQMIYLIAIPTVFSFIMQIVCQKEVGSFKAALVFALEAPFASFFAMAFYGETLNGIEALGGLILFLTSVIPESWLNSSSKGTGKG